MWGVFYLKEVLLIQQGDIEIQKDDMPARENQAVGFFKSGLRFVYLCVVRNTKRQFTHYETFIFRFTISTFFFCFSSADK